MRANNKKSGLFIHFPQYSNGILDRGNLLHHKAPFSLDFPQIATAGIRTYIVEYTIESLALIIGTHRIAHEVHHHLALLQRNLLTTQLAAQASERNNLQQFFSLPRNLSETVKQSLAVSLQVVIVLDVLQLAVKEHALTG